MAYPGEYPGGYLRPELGEDAPVSFGDPAEIGAADRGFRPGGYGPPEGYGRPGYGAGGYGRGGGYGGGGYGAPAGYPGEGYGRPGYGRGGYGPEGYGPPQPPPQVMYVHQPPVDYVEPETSDLGMGARDSHVVDSTDYRAGYGPSELGYGAMGGYADGEKERLREELEHERKRKHEAEVVAAAAIGYGLHERHEKHEAEGDLERYNPGAEKKHHFFGLD